MAVIAKPSTTLRLLRQVYILQLSQGPRNGFELMGGQSEIKELKFSKKVKIGGSNEVHCIYCLKLMGCSHALAKIDGWHTTPATRSYEGPAGSDRGLVRNINQQVLLHIVLYLH